MKVRNWLDENYSQQQIAEMNAKLYRQLCIFTPDDRVEDPAADDLRDQMDVFCYAGSHELNEKAIRQVVNEFTGCDAMLQGQMIADMQNCQQTANQSIYQHGESVRDHLFQLIHFLETGAIEGEWKLPLWMTEYRAELLQALLPKEIVAEYALFHDCGKPYCLTIDQDGKRHFPNHAEASCRTWLSVSDNHQVANLIKMDMMIHTIKAADIDDFVKHPEAITLLMAGLAEVHSNAKMFGGLDSESFKIKWSQINKRGKAILEKLYGKKERS